MDWMINSLNIQNFKSIKAQNIKCKRINVFIGKPNVGKSNILEAVSMLSGYNTSAVYRLDFNNQTDFNTRRDKLFSEVVRYEKFRNLFYDNDRSESIFINTNLGYFFSKYHQNNIDQYDLLFGKDPEIINHFLKNHSNDSIQDLANYFNDYIKNKKTEISLTTLTDFWSIRPFYFTTTDEGRVAFHVTSKENKYWGNIKRYEFDKEIHLTDKNSNFLKPPHGENLFMLLETNPKLFDEVAEIFDQYDLQLLFDNETNKLEIQKTIGKRVYKIPYSLCADTLQRYIFHLLAIKTNKQSILVLEEPEAHSFPPYISAIANEIVEDKDNQYFIATHSPYLLTEFIEKCDSDELALFICDYKDYKTVIRKLSEEEINNITETGIDLFYNISAFSE